LLSQPDERRDLRLPRQVYRLRVLGLAPGFVTVATTFYEHKAPRAYWAAIAAQGFVWPHVAWLLAKHRADPHRAERLNLTIDSAFGGLFIALMRFSLLPSVLVAGMLSMDKIGWGPRFLARSSAAMVIACAATVVLFHPGFDPTTTMREIVGSLPLMTAYPLAVAFASYSSGRMVRERRKAVEELALLRDELAHIARVATLGAIQTTLDFDERAPLVRLDRIEIQQGLVNLIRNAIEAMNHPSSAERRLTIATRRDGASVRVAVADSGPGIDPAIADRLFHPFHSTKSSGLGLGLSICQSLVEAHGGRIGTLPSDRGGAVFFFELPFASDTA